jgi:hypothetical protein
MRNLPYFQMTLAQYIVSGIALPERKSDPVIIIKVSRTSILRIDAAEGLSISNTSNPWDSSEILLFVKKVSPFWIWS